MYLKTLIGPNAGQVFDFSPAAAEAMLADGRGARQYPDQALSEEVVAEPANPKPPIDAVSAAAAEEAVKPAASHPAPPIEAVSAAAAAEAGKPAAPPFRPARHNRRRR